MAEETRIGEGLEVYSSDGERIGRVKSAGPGRLSVDDGMGRAHDLPAEWISHIDGDVHLRHDAAVVRGRLRGIPEPPPRPTEGKLVGPWIIGGIFLVIALVLLVWAIAGYW